jgi:hypothetical protein
MTAARRWMCRPCAERHSPEPWGDSAQASCASGMCQVCGVRPVYVHYCAVGDMHTFTPGVIAPSAIGATCNTAGGAGAAPTAEAPVLRTDAPPAPGAHASRPSDETAGHGAKQMELF